jgi:hypothetical protein
MVHIYYHIYAIDGVESIIDEQLSLIEKHFDFPYTLNIGISIANENVSTSKILEKIKPNLKDIRSNGSEWTTLDLIEKDKEKFSDSDYIFYIHTKGASRQNDDTYENIISWRHLMNYFNIEKVKNVFKLFEKTEFNTYGVLFVKRNYSGNFWWARAEYLKTLNLEGIIPKDRFAAENGYIAEGKNHRPYSAYNFDSENNHYYWVNFKKELYR